MDVDSPIILGFPTCTDLNRVILNFGVAAQKALKSSATPKPTCDPDPVAKDELLRNHGDCFQGIGCFQGEFHITDDPTVPPVVHPPSRVPEALKEPLEKEWDSSVGQGISAKVIEPTDCVNSLVCVTKNTGALRLSLDPKNLNLRLKMSSRSSMLQNAFRSWLDARSGYWNIIQSDRPADFLGMVQFLSCYSLMSHNLMPIRELRSASSELSGLYSGKTSLYPQSNGLIERTVQTGNALSP